MSISKEEVKAIEFNSNLKYIQGLKDGIRMYSWMKDGVPYVGTTGKTLKKALQEIDDEYAIK